MINNMNTHLHLVCDNTKPPSEKGRLAIEDDAHVQFLLKTCENYERACKTLMSIIYKQNMVILGCSRMLDLFDQARGPLEAALEAVAETDGTVLPMGFPQ